MDLGQSDIGPVFDMLKKTTTTGCLEDAEGIAGEAIMSEETGCKVTFMFISSGGMFA